MLRKKSEGAAGRRRWGAGRGRGNSGQQRESWEVSVYEETAEWRCVSGRGKRESRSRAAPDSVSGRRAADETGVVVRFLLSSASGSAGQRCRRRKRWQSRPPKARRCEAFSDAASKRRSFSSRQNARRPGRRCLSFLPNPARKKRPPACPEEAQIGRNSPGRAGPGSAAGGVVAANPTRQGSFSWLCF